MVKNITLLLLFICLFYSFGFSQPNDVNPNGYNKFYYSNGKISSEGNMVNGKPDGFWKTYYVDGVLKSIGNRLNFELDSTWLFFNEKGDTTQKIDYKNGKKNGARYIRTPFFYLSRMNLLASAPQGGQCGGGARPSCL